MKAEIGRLVWVFTCSLLLVCTNCVAADDHSASRRVCGPFGDPPATVIGKVSPHCWGGELLGPWRESDGTERYACVFRPPGGISKGPRPLLIYLHPSLLGTITIHFTNLLHYQTTHDFILLAPIGRKTIHYYPFPDEHGIGWDIWYRQLTPGEIRIGDTRYQENVDAAAIDHFREEEIKHDGVDPRQIYITGWSNGAAMGYLYALNRPGIAAVAAYSGPDPFGAFDDHCRQKPVLAPPANDRQIRIVNPHVPIMNIHPSCDAAGICPNIEQLVAELRAAEVNVRDVIIDWLGYQTDSCNRLCGSNPNGDANLLSNFPGWTAGLLNHGLWPTSKTPPMLEFLESHSLQPRAHRAAPSVEEHGRRARG